VIPDILRVLLSYLRYHRIQTVAYIYDHHEAQRRIYELLKLINNDDYFNNFAVHFRSICQDDVYSILYSLEVNALNKEDSSRYVLLDLATYRNYELMFNKISHMGKIDETSSLMSIAEHCV
jgi:hypothetical protein